MPRQVVEGRTANGRCVVRVRAHALPQAFAAALDEHEPLLRRCLTLRAHEAGEAQPMQAETNGESGVLKIMCGMNLMICVRLGWRVLMACVHFSCPYPPLLRYPLLLEVMPCLICYVLSLVFQHHLLSLAMVCQTGGLHCNVTP